VNFPPKQIANFTSEFLLTGFYTNEGVVLASIDKNINDGEKLS
jgi:tRNA-binding protein